jgi:hypothetical protein
VFTKAVDTSMKRLQTKMLDVTGPLSKLWTKLLKAKKTPDKSCNIDSIISLVEQSIHTPGQANVLSLFHRRLNVLTGLVKDHRKASDILRSNEGVIRK